MNLKSRCVPVLNPIRSGQEILLSKIITIRGEAFMNLLNVKFMVHSCLTGDRHYLLFVPLCGPLAGQLMANYDRIIKDQVHAPPPLSLLYDEAREYNDIHQIFIINDHHRRAADCTIRRGRNEFEIMFLSYYLE